VISHWHPAGADDIGAIPKALFSPSMAEELTHADLNALGDRMQATMQAAVTQLREDWREDIRQVHGRIGELVTERRLQNARVEKVEDRTAAIERQASTTRHDLANHVAAHESFASVVESLKTLQTAGVTAVQTSAPAAAAQPDIEPGRPSKAFVAGAVAAATVLAGAAQAAIQAGVQLYHLVTELAKKVG
jgi:hypothetical protein